MEEQDLASLLDKLGIGSGELQTPEKVETAPEPESIAAAEPLDAAADKVKKICAEAQEYNPGIRYQGHNALRKGFARVAKQGYLAGKFQQDVAGLIRLVDQTMDIYANQQQEMVQRVNRDVPYLSDALRMLRDDIQENQERLGQAEERYAETKDTGFLKEKAAVFSYLGQRTQQLAVVKDRILEIEEERQQIPARCQENVEKLGITKEKLYAVLSEVTGRDVEALRPEIEPDHHGNSMYHSQDAKNTAQPQKGQ
ncbi:hypothetical protein GF351_00075, partial [Candidatus Woesearchaeota archaeon]|nr:hypothetical protein [Candidatus Woesearchaeota archaeon]